jgi:D-arginine utilization repressor
MKTTFNQQLKVYQPFIEAIVELFHPFVEAAIHDLKSGKIVALYNNLSRRKVGQNSPLKELEVPANQLPDYFAPYYKTNWDGRPLKCTSITVRDAKGEAIGLICFNFDTTFFQGIQSQLASFLAVVKEAKHPLELTGDWQKCLEELIQEYEREHHVAVSHLTRSQKRDLVRFLYENGIFNYKNAPNLIAKSLHISRASVYNYLQKETVE